jgi:energy-coupling factor transporter ATP-binding protein EcfA2
VTGILQAEAVAYRYPQNGYGLAPISLAAQSGERILIAGPSGCGKSTLARCLTGLIPHLYRGTFEGAVWLDGLHTIATPLWRLAERGGLVFQNPAAQMLGQSVEEEITFGLENLSLPPAAISELLEATLDRFGLQPLRKRSPQTLSGGEQQKLALAAIMARRPPVLILDEPLSMLDTTAAAELVAYLGDLADSGTALVICEHRHEMVHTIPGLRTISLPGYAREETQNSLAHLPSRLASTPVLEVSGLTVHLGGRSVLHDLSFSASGGEVLAVVGRNGVGKTTLLRALTGLQKHQGVVTVDGRPPDLGMVFQNADLQLFNATVRDEILYRVPDPDLALYAWLLEALGLTRYEQVAPLLLSEGEKKRVALATVLIRQPRHGLLLDEPAVGQDSSHKAMLIHLARALAHAGKLVIMTTHDLALAAQADRLLLLGLDGFVADGPPAVVLHDQSAWARLGLLVPEWVHAAPPGIPGRGEL